MRGIKEFLRPGSLDYAFKLLDMNQGKAIVLAGGTHLALVKKTEADVIIDIKKAGLNYIKEEEGYIKIGATSRAVDIINSNLLKDFAGGLLGFASSKIGSPLTQNLVTVGGNVYSLLPWSNLPPAFLVLDAEVKISSLSEQRLMKLEDFLKANPRKEVKPGEIITEILVPNKSKGLKTCYKTFSITENDYDMAMVVVAMNIEGNICKDVKLAVGAAVSPCSIVPEIEELLKGKEVTSELIENAAEKAVSSLKFVKDFRTTPEHLMEVVKVLIRRVLQEVSK